MFRDVIQQLGNLRREMRSRQEFRRAFKEFLKSPSRCKDMSQQEILRRNFVLRGYKDFEWAVGLLKKKEHKATLRTEEVDILHLESAEILSAVETLKRDGVWVCPKRLSPDMVASISEKIKKKPLVSRSDASDVQTIDCITPKGATYWYDQQDLLGVEEFVFLAKDRGLQDVVARYLECTPSFDMMTSWWSFPTAVADSASAQLFHFDLDRIRFLKVFVYLTDVTESNGPHVFVLGSHNQTGNVVSHDGRYSDEEVRRLLPDCPHVSLCGPAGTVFIEDTLGFHKGKPVESGRRCVFEYQYSVCDFGYPYADVRLD